MSHRCMYILAIIHIYVAIYSPSEGYAPYPKDSLEEVEHICKNIANSKLKKLYVCESLTHIT